MDKNQQSGRLCPVIKECSDVLNSLDSFMPSLRQIYEAFKTRVSEGKPDDELDETLLQPYIKAWTEYKPALEERWRLIANAYSAPDPFCSVQAHWTDLGKKCRYQPQAIANDKPFNAYLQQGFFPNKPRGISKLDDLWERDMFIHHWAFITWHVLRFVERRIPILGIITPKEVTTFMPIWFAKAVVIQVVWTFALGSDFFAKPIVAKCFYEAWLVSQNPSNNQDQPTKEGVEDTSGIKEGTTSTEVGSSKTHVSCTKNETANINGHPLHSQICEDNILTQSKEPIPHEPKNVVSIPEDKFNKIKERYRSMENQVQLISKENEDLKNSLKQYEKEGIFSQLKTISEENQILRDNLTEAKQANECLKQQLSTTKESLQLRKQYNLLAANFEQLQGHVQELQSSNRQLSQNQKKHADNVLRLEADNKELCKAKQDLLNSMSAVMNQQMARNETDLENINVKNRPMKILEDYHLFCSQEWLDSKTALDDFVAEADIGDVFGEPETCGLVLTAMMKCFELAEKLFSSVLHAVEDPLQPVLLHSLIEGFGDLPERKSNLKDTLDVDLKVQIAKYYKEKCDSIGFKDIAKVLMNNEMSSCLDGKALALSNDRDLAKFYERCLELCWKMVLQQPSMSFRCVPPVGGKFEDDKHELHFGSANPTNPKAVIKYFVHPGLYHGKNIMKKARVVLHVEDYP